MDMAIEKKGKRLSSQRFFNVFFFELVDFNVSVFGVLSVLISALLADYLHKHGLKTVVLHDLMCYNVAAVSHSADPLQPRLHLG